MEPMNWVMAVSALTITFLLAQGLARLDDRFGSICMVDEWETMAHHKTEEIGIWKEKRVVDHYSRLLTSNPYKHGQISQLVPFNEKVWTEAAARDMEFIVQHGKPFDTSGLGRCTFCGTKVTHLDAHCKNCGGPL
jgi:hypothetical protein